MAFPVLLDQRQEERLALPAGSLTSASLRLLPITAGTAPVAVDIVNFSGRGIRLTSPCSVPANQLVQLDWNNALLLGEVAYCIPGELPGSFAIGIALEHCLSQTDRVAALRARFLADELHVNA